MMMNNRMLCLLLLLLLLLLNRSNSYQPSGSRVVVAGSKPLSAFSNLTDIFAGKVLGCTTSSTSTTTMGFCAATTGGSTGSSGGNAATVNNSSQGTSKSPLHQSLCSNRTSSSSLASLGEDSLTSAEMQAVPWNNITTSSSDAKYVGRKGFFQDSFKILSRFFQDSFKILSRFFQDLCSTANI